MEQAVSQTQTSSSIKKNVEKSKIQVSRIFKSEYQKEGTMTAELKQAITTTSSYPSKVVSNSLQNNIFSTSDFGFEEQDYVNTENRVAWIDVPLDATVEMVQEKLDSFKEATLYRILSNKPILADTEKYAVDNPEINVTLDTFANRQVVRYGTGHEKEGKITVDQNGKVQYRRIAFDKNGKTDVDERTSETNDFYASEQIEHEINNTDKSSVIKNQSI